MKDRIIYFCLLLTGILSVCACVKSDVDQESSSEIYIYADVLETKGLLNQSAFAKQGNKIKVYDVFRDLNAQSDNIYIDNEAICQSAANWKFIDSDGNFLTYYWTLTGTHKLFGWLSEDKSMTSVCNTPQEYFGDGFSFDTDDYKLTIPERAMKGDEPQLDFLYSDIETRQMGNSAHSAVDLSFNHLFSAIGIGVKNNMESSSIIIQDFKVVGLHNSSSAEIDFSTGSAVVNYGEYHKEYGDDEGEVFKSLSAQYEIPANSQVADIFDGSSTESYTLIWPQSKENIHSTSTPVDDGETVTYPEDWLMYIKYASDGKESVQKVNFPNANWEAGKKYHFDLVFAEKHIDIDFKVSPWDYDEQTVDYSSESVVASKAHRLTWRETNCTFDPQKGYAYIQGGLTVYGDFQFDAPIGATWLATLTGDIDAFTLSPESGVIDGRTPSVIKISPKENAKDIQKDLMVQVKFAVRRTDGRTISGDDIIQPENDQDYDKYTIVLPAN